MTGAAVEVTGLELVPVAAGVVPVAAEVIVDTAEVTGAAAEVTVDTADVTDPDPEPEPAAVVEVAGLELVPVAAAVVPVAAELTVDTAEVTGAAAALAAVAGLELVPVAAAVVPVIAEVADVTTAVAEGSGVEVEGVTVCCVRLPGEHQQDDHDPGSGNRDLHRSVSDASQDRLRHEQLPHHGDRPDPARSARHRRPETCGHALFQADVAVGHPEPDIGRPPRMYCSATTVQYLPGSGKGARIPAAELAANSASRRLLVLHNRDYQGLSGTRSGHGQQPAPGPALVATAAGADPVTLLVTAWLSTRRSENARTAYVRAGWSPIRPARMNPSGA